MTELTPLTQAYGYVVKIIDETNSYWSFHVVDLAIECFGRSFPEQPEMRKQLLDLRADRWHEKFSPHKLEA